MNKKLIIIEGTDNVGKDTVINQLLDRYKDAKVYHCEKPKSKDAKEAAKEQYNSFLSLAKENVKSNYETIIHNRSWYGEYVYGVKYRNNNEKEVKKSILEFENIILDSSYDVCLIMLLSNNSDFLVKNDDGLSISKAKKELIEDETKRFEDIFRFSTIPNKRIIYVNEGENWKTKEGKMKKVDCIQISNALLEHVKKFLNQNSLTPKLAIVQISEDDEVCANTKTLESKCNVCGIDVIVEHLSKDSTNEQLEDCLEKLNNDTTIDGIFLSFSPTLCSIADYNLIAPEKDVYGFGLKSKHASIFTSIISSILSINNIDLFDKNVVVDSCYVLQEKTICELVMKTFKNISFFDTELLDEDTLKSKFENADIIISLINKPNYIKWCKDNVIVFDYSKIVSSNEQTESNFDDSIKEKIGLYTCVDGGLYDLALTEICVNTAKSAFVFRN